MLNGKRYNIYAKVAGTPLLLSSMQFSLSSVTGESQYHDYNNKATFVMLYHSVPISKVTS